MSRFFYIKSNVKTTTDYRQTNSSSGSSKELRQPNLKLSNSTLFNYDSNQQNYSSFLNKDFTRRERNQNCSGNANTSVEMNFLTNYKNLKKFYDSPPAFSSYNLQSKIIAANLSYEIRPSSTLNSNTSPNMQSILSSFYMSDYQNSQSNKYRRSRGQCMSVRAPRTSFLENFERTQMLIRNNFMLNTNSNVGNLSSYSVPNIHNPKMTASSSLNKSSYDAGFNLSMPPKTSFENSLSSSGIGIDNEVGYDDYKLNVPYDEFQVTHFRDKTLNYAKIAKANMKSNFDGIGNDNQSEGLNIEINEIKKRRGRNEKMSIVDSIIAKYQPDPSGDFIQTKSSDLSNNSSDFKKFRLDSDQEPSSTAFHLQNNKIQQGQHLLMQIQNQDEEIDQLSELSLGSQESISTSVSTTPTSSPKLNKTEFNKLGMDQQNSASEVLIDSRSTKQNEKSTDEAIIISNGNKKMINLSEKLERFRSTISIVRKTEEDFGDLLKSEDDDDETSSIKPSNSSELKDMQAEALSEPSIFFNDQLQDEIHEKDSSKNNEAQANNEKSNTNEENDHATNS